MGELNYKLLKCIWEKWKFNYNIKKKEKILLKKANYQYYWNILSRVIKEWKLYCIKQDENNEIRNKIHQFLLNSLKFQGEQVPEL